MPRTSITISAPLIHAALHIRPSSLPGGAILFPSNSSYCLSHSILIHRELTSQFQPFRYYKLSQTTVEINFTHSPGLNHSEIHGAPPSSFGHWWIMCSWVCQPWWDGRLSGWHWDYGGLISCDRLVRLLFRFHLVSLLNYLAFAFIHLNVAMQTIECWMRCWVL